ncbi:MAG: PorT family protein [Saprospiraceae bacterium]|nr:PorT family protein [Candidatus Brachybacter algidus]HQW72295.1 porin family protein [Saprospiraceae bacterium]
MKQLIFAILVITVFNANIFAQDSNEDLRERFSIGIKAGGNLSNVYDEQGDNFVADPKLGFVGGVFLNMPLGALIGIQPALLYSQKGFKGDGSFLGTKYSFTRTSTFLDVPILLAIKPTNFITILGGPQYSYLLKQKDEFNGPGVSVDQEDEFKNDDIKKNIFGLTGGVDINVNNIVIGARAAWDVSKNGEPGSNTPRYKNVLYQATIGLRF